MELSTGNVYQNQTLSHLLRHLEIAAKDNYIDNETYMKMRAALERLTDPTLCPDNGLLMDLSILKEGFKRYKPSYVSAWAFDSVITGVVKGVFALCLTVALAPEAPFWLYFTLPSVMALTDYLFFHHLYAAETARQKLYAFETAYLREQVAIKLVNQTTFFGEALVRLKDTPVEEALTPALMALKKHLLLLYRTNHLTIEGAIGLNNRMNQMIEALVDNKGEAVFEKLNDIERLLGEAARPSYELTNITLNVGVLVGVCVVALSIVSAGTFTAFCAATLAVTLFTARVAFLSYILDSVSNWSMKSKTNDKFDAFSSNVKTFFNDLREGRSLEDVYSQRETSNLDTVHHSIDGVGKVPLGQTV